MQNMELMKKSVIVFLFLVAFFFFINQFKILFIITYVSLFVFILLDYKIIDVRKIVKKFAEQIESFQSDPTDDSNNGEDEENNESDIEDDPNTDDEESDIEDNEEDELLSDLEEDHNGLKVVDDEEHLSENQMDSLQRSLGSDIGKLK